MKKKCFLLVAVLLLCLEASAWAEGGVRVEVIKMDGISVVMLTQAEELINAYSFAASTPQSKDNGFTMPQYLTQIGKEAFAGIAAEKIEVSENVVTIGERAFADCNSLREIVIPPSVMSVDESALAGCKNVIVYGEKGSAAEKYVGAINKANPDAEFLFVELKSGADESQDKPVEEKYLPVVMPFVPAV